MKGKSIKTLTKEMFGRCKRNGDGVYGSLIAEEKDSVESDTIESAGTTILVIG